MTHALCKTCETNPRAIGTRGRILKYCSRECRNTYKAKLAIRMREEARNATHKVCRSCNTHLPIHDFHRDRRRIDGRYPWCKTCRRTYMGTSERKPKFRTKREYDIDYRAKRKALEGSRGCLENRLWTTYRIDADDYNRLLAKQHGRCAICGEHGTTTTSSSKYGNRHFPLHVDHDHSCCPGRTSCGNCIRGLLCVKCNSGIGMLNDDPSLIQAALEYLTTSDR